MPEYIEEDFRFVTPVEAAHYNDEDLRLKPHMDGHQLAQVLDQLDGMNIALGQELKPFIVAPSGTALCLVKHLDFYSIPHIASVAVTEVLDPRAIYEISHSPAVSVCFNSAGSKNDIIEGIKNSNCFVLCCLGDLTYWFDLIELVLGGIRKPVIAFDPKYDLRLKEGNYFMNSFIWVSASNGN